MQDKKHFKPMKWGFIPYWAKDPKIRYKMINARIESVQEKLLKAALNVEDAWYHLMGTMNGKKVKKKTPYRIVVEGGKLFAIAGLWDKRKSPTGEIVESFTMITQAPGKKLAEIHDRMPAILLPEQESLWLDESMSPAECLQMIIPYPEDLIYAFQVGDRVGKVSENDKGLIEPVEKL